MDISTKCQKNLPFQVGKQIETLSLHRLNDVNDIEFSEIGQELLNDCKIKWQATSNRETNKLRTYRLMKTEFIS